MILAALELKDWLGFTVVSAFIGAVTTLVALFLKEYVFARSFENWKRRIALRTIYLKYRDPITLSGIELCNRLSEMIKYYPPTYCDGDVLTSQPARQEANTREDPYFKNYKLFSTIYRMCAFLGWLELYRREIVFLDSGHHKINKQLEACEEAIRSDLADGQLNEADDWEDWNDVLVFREEQRAIGETMIRECDSEYSVIGYGTFRELATFQGDEEPNPWIRSVASFLINHDSSRKDFRLIRFKRLAVHLMDLIELLDAERLPKYLKNRRSEISKGITVATIHE